MKVLHIVSGDGWGGLEQVVALLADGFRSRPGFEVEALLFNEGRLADVLRHSGVKVYIIPESEHTFLELVQVTRQWLRTRKPDVVHAHRYKEILAAALAILSGWRCGLVVTLHGLPSAQLPRAQSALASACLIVARLAGARFVGVSLELTKRLRRVAGRGRVTHVGNPVPTVQEDNRVEDLRLKAGWELSRPLVGFVGRLERVKGPDLLLEIAAQTTSSAGFVVIGGGSLDGELRARVTEAGLSDRIAFLGEVPNASRYIGQFDALVLPSRHEGLPLVLLEAAAREVPVVAFDVGGVREALDGGGAAATLVPATDVVQFSQKLDHLLRNRAAVRSDLQRWALAVRSRFSLAAISDKYSEIYQAVAPRSSRPR